MTRTIAERVRWLQQNWTVKDGSPWTIEGREWVLEEIIRPLYGWKISSGGDGKLCSRCAKFAGRIVEWLPDIEDLIDRDHGLRHDGACPGLVMRKIQVVVVCVNRRGGKTTNVCALAGEMISHDEYVDMMMFAAAGAQTSTLFRENLLEPLRRIEDDGGEIDDFESNGERVWFPDLHSQFEIVDSSRRSVTGRGKNRLIVEEARDVDGAMLVKALPSILDRNFLTCREGHRFPFSAEDRERRRKHCPVCTSRLEPHFGTVVIVSSGGVIDDSPALKWFAELVVMLEEKPQPAFHVFRDDDVANPAIAQESRDVMSVFEAVPSIGSMMTAEMSNTLTAAGDIYIDRAELARVTDPQLHHVDGTDAPCILFFDTSLKKDLLSLTALATDDGSAPFWRRGAGAEALPPWTLVNVPSIFWWDPKAVFRTSGGVVHYEEVAWALLAPILPLFPNAREIWIDVRGQLWAHRLVELGRASGTPWGRKFQRYQHGGKEEEVRRTGFTTFEQRVKGRTIRMFAHDRVRQEIEGLKKVQNAKGYFDVVDRKRKLMHADIVSGIAALCGRAWELRVQRRTIGELNAATPGTARAIVDRMAGFGKLTPDSF